MKFLDSNKIDHFQKENIFERRHNKQKWYGMITIFGFKSA